MTQILTPILIGARRVERRSTTRPEPGPGQLVLRCRANALCGSDHGLFEHGSTTVAGHELAGEVVATGAGTTTPVGARGVVYLMAYCGRCRSCAAGATNVCLAKTGDQGFNRDGGLGPYALVEERMFFAVDDSIDFALATVLLDVMGTSGHALDRALAVRRDVESVHVAGAGPVGLGAVVMSTIRFGPDVPVYVSDVSGWRLDLAASFGAVPVAVEAVGDLPAYDLAIDASGQAVARESAIRGLGRRGVLVCVGHGGGLNLDVSRDLISREVTVLGSEYFPYADLARNHALLLEHRELIAPVITHRFDVAQVQEAFETFFDGRTGKVVVTQNGEPPRVDGDQAGVNGG